MRKILIALVFVLSASLGLKAEQVVGDYESSYFRKNFTIEASEKNGKLESVYIGVEAKDSKKAFISVDGN